MANLPQQTTYIQYTNVDGVSTNFAFPFYIPTENDIAVYVTPAGQAPDPAIDIQVLSVDYSVTGEGSPIFAGGSITFLSGHIPASGATVTLTRQVINETTIDFSESRNIKGINLNSAIDRVMLCVQQNTTNFKYFGLQYNINEELPLDAGNPIANIVPPLPNNYIWVGQNGGIVAALLEQNPDWSTLRTQLANQAPVTNGASLIGYNDPNTLNTAQTLKTYLDNMPTFILNRVGNNAYGAYGNGAGTANAITVTVTQPFALVAGQIIRVKVSTANTGATTLTVTSTFTGSPVVFTTKNVYVNGAAGLRACKGGEIMPAIHTFIYNGTQFEVLDPVATEIVQGQVLLNAGIVIPDNTATLVPWDTIVSDPFSLFTGTPTFGFTLPKAGWYFVNCQLFILHITANNAFGFMTIYKNNVAISNSRLNQQYALYSGSEPDITLSGCYEGYFAAGDVITIKVTINHETPVSQNIGSPSNFQIVYRGC